MKSKITIIVIGVLIVLVLFYFFIVRCNRKLPELNNYSIVSNTGVTIPAKLYKRNIDSEMDGHLKNVSEFILCFNDELISDKLNISGDEKLYKYLVIVPDLKIIGLVNQTKSLKDKGNYICQIDEKANDFTSIINNHTFYSNPPIKEASFTGEKIIFNTYGVLKRFGDRIIIKIDKNK